MYLLDTNVISELRKLGTPRISSSVVSWFADRDVDTLYTSAITIAEIRYGILNKARRDSAQGTVLDQWFKQQVVTAFEGRILGIDMNTALIFAEFQLPAPKPFADTWIAAIAKQHGLCLVTRNEKDFESFPINVINPWSC